MVIASSTAATTSLQQDNMRMHGANEGISDPYWLYLEVWLYEGLAFLNYAGIGNPDHKGTKPDVSFGDFMRAYCIEHGVEFARPHVFGWGHSRSSPRHAQASEGVGMGRVVFRLLIPWV